MTAKVFESDITNCLLLIVRSLKRSIYWLRLMNTLLNKTRSTIFNRIIYDRQRYSLWIYYQVDTLLDTFCYVIWELYFSFLDYFYLMSTAVKYIDSHLYCFQFNFQQDLHQQTLQIHPSLFKYLFVLQFSGEVYWQCL